MLKHKGVVFREDFSFKRSHYKVHYANATPHHLSVRALGRALKRPVLRISPYPDDAIGAASYDHVARVPLVLLCETAAQNVSFRPKGRVYGCQQLAFHGPQVQLGLCARCNLTLRKTERRLIINIYPSILLFKSLGFFKRN